MRPEVMGGLGGFGALCEIPAGYKQPVDILVINETDIPRSTTGKVQRHFVEEMLKTYFNLESFN